MQTYQREPFLKDQILKVPILIEPSLIEPSFNEPIKDTSLGDPNLKNPITDPSLNQEFALPYLNFQINADWVHVHNTAIKCARNLKSSYRELLSTLIAVEQRKLYYQLEVTSLYAYCVDVLDLPTHTAYDFIDVVRTSKLIPELAEAVISGRTTITKARRVCSVITIQNKKEWIDLASQCSQKIVQRAVAIANPRSIVPESLNYVSSNVLELRLAVSEEWAILSKDVKDLMSQREKRSVSTEEALFILMKSYKQKSDPVKKAERAKMRRRRSQEPNETLPETRYRPMSVEHEVVLRDQNQCVHIDRFGRRCTSKRWLEKHHVKEFSKGGEHTADNLETLCSAHHRIKHLRQAEVSLH